VKLIRANPNHLVFEIGREEKNLLFEILGLYPMISTAGQRLSRTASAEQLKEHQQLLEESLAAQRKENRRNVLALLNEPGRFHAVPPGFDLKISRPEIEWLLQVLNDIRVGSWIALGSPDTENGEKIVLSEGTAPRIRSMELAGAFEMVLLEALAGHRT